MQGLGSHSHPTQESSHGHKGGPISSSTLNPRPHTSIKENREQPKHTNIEENKNKRK